MRFAFAAHKLQEGVFAVLSQNTQVMSQITALYDSPDIDGEMPYISFGETGTTPFDTSDSYGSRVTFDLSIWSKTTDQMEAKELMALVYDSLMAADIPVDGFDLHRLNLQSSSINSQSYETHNYTRGALVFSGAFIFA